MGEIERVVLFEVITDDTPIGRLDGSIGIFAVGTIKILYFA